MRIPCPVLTLLLLCSAALPAQDGPPSDPRIERAVADELIGDHAVPAHLLQVQVHDGVVTLTGVADQVLAAERAAAIARTVRGVRAVVNRIAVQPPLDLDQQELRSRVAAALEADPATDRHEVRVAAEPDGTVTLAGEVQSWAERELCETVAKGVTGVTRVDNQIEVRFLAERPDGEIADEVMQLLHWHTLIDDGLVHVACRDGEVILSGSVGSAAERLRAIGAAWVAGVRAVTADDLRVEGWQRDDRLRASKYAVRSDQQIEQAVEAALLQDPRVASFQVRVEVEHGVVTLRGTVDNLKARRAAASDARNTVGVIRIDNRLRVSPLRQRSDAVVGRAVHEALLRDPLVDRFDLRVRVRNGTVHLYGTVDSGFERACADDVAARVRGVVAVENHITVTDDAIVSFDPYVDDWPIHLQPWYRYQPAATFTPDAEIARRIREELWWSPFVDESRVAVQVADGTATLSGKVDSNAERLAAIENAYDGGAVWVVDELAVAGTPAAEDQ